MCICCIRYILLDNLAESFLVHVCNVVWHEACVWVCACVHAWVRACVRTCVRACVCCSSLHRPGVLASEEV